MPTVAAKKKAAKNSTQPKTKISKAGREAIAEAQRKRWATYRKEQKASVSKKKK